MILGRGRFGGNFFRAGQWACALALLTGLLTTGSAVATPDLSHKGVEIGNGISLSRETLLSLGMESLSGLDIPEDQSSLEFLAPASDWSPQTRVRVDLYASRFSPEKLLKSLLPSEQGWVGMTMGNARRFHRERPIGGQRHLFELQAFQDDKRIVVKVEGNKEKSMVYSTLLEELLVDCESAD